MIEGYKTVKEIADEWNISERRVRTLCSDGIVEGAAKLGREWVIPESAQKPADRRETTGEYKNWRNKAVE